VRKRVQRPRAPCYKHAMTIRFTKYLPGLALGLLMVMMALPAKAEGPEQPRSFGATALSWDQTLDRIDQAVKGGAVSGEQAAGFRKEIAALRAAAKAEKDVASGLLATAEKLAAAIGSAPEEGSAPESADIAVERKKLDAERGRYRDRLARIDVTLARCDGLEEQIFRLSRFRFVGTLTKPFPMPLARETVAKAGQEFVQDMRELAAIPGLWWLGLPPDVKNDASIWGKVAAAALLAFGAAFAIAGLLLRYFGRRPDMAAASYARRCLAAVTEIGARSLVPILLGFVVVNVVIEPLVRADQAVSDLINSVFAALIAYVIAATVPLAAFSPGLPAWRLVPVTAENARALSWRIKAIAWLIAIDAFFQSTAEQVGGVSDELASVYALIFNLATALLVFGLLPARLWRNGAGVEGSYLTFLGLGARAVSAARVVLGAAMLLGAIAAISGYTNLSSYVIRNLLASGLLIAGAAILLTIAREGIAVAQRRLGLGALAHGADGEPGVPPVAAAGAGLDFWAALLVDLVVLTGLGVVLALTWGIPIDEIARFGIRAVEGIKIGTVTISLSDIALAILVFVVAMAATRMVQRLLAERLFPRTRLDPSLQQSIIGGLGFVGIVVAASLAIATAGVDLTNIALIAGALSLGIGFGLQNVVNNFVSGLILLFERPVKVGDWVVIGANEGFVKRINVRATELETSELASVIIPNAEILSGPVKNWTLKDRQGRLEVAVGVEYDADPELVRSILLELAHAHPKVLAYPEPFVLFTAFGASSMDFSLRCFTDDILARGNIASDLRFAIHARFKAEGLTIPYPQSVVRYVPLPAAVHPAENLTSSITSDAGAGGSA